MQDKFINPRKLSGVILIIIILIPFLVLIGWQFNISLLKSILPNLIAMNPTTAFLFILSGISLYLIREENSEKTIKFGNYIGLAIACIALIKIAGFNKNLDIGIDQLIFKNRLQGNSIAPNTVFNFILVGISLFLIDYRKKSTYIPSQLISLLAFIISLLAIIGYLYAARSLYRLSVYIPMAIHTAITFILLATGILLSRYRDGFIGVIMHKNIGGYIARRLIPIGVAIPILVGFLRLEGQKYNLYDQEFGSALGVIFIISISSLLMWLKAKYLNRTDEKRKKAELEVLEAKKLAEQTQGFQEQFLANMSHEIRTPMNGIKGMTDLLLETQLNDEQKDFTKTIQRSSDSLLVIINDILDLSKIQAGKLTIEKINFNLREVLEHVKGMFKYLLNEKGLILQLNVNADVPAILNGDPHRLNQILVNLLGNAIKFTSSGCVDIRVSVEENTAKEIILNFAIADTGIGIEKDKIDEIFKSFAQASINTSRKYGGTGLGLSITKQLLELQGGKISVESEINKGSIFKFTIPYNYKQADSSSLFIDKDSKEYRSLLKGKKFLIVEDNEVNQKVTRHVLQQAGGTADVANHGLEAIALLEKNPDYDVIIMDLQMPQMDGYAATRYIRSVLKLSIPIIAMTATALKGEKEKCMEAGMNDYVSKPFDFQFLYNRISLLLNVKPMSDTKVTIDKSDSGNLFDLSLLEEMDDNEYIAEVLTIFLKNTPEREVHKTAHKLKSSIGLLKANDLLNVMKKLEENGKAEKSEGLVALAELAIHEYKKIETPLQENLKNIQTVIASAV